MPLRPSLPWLLATLAAALVALTIAAGASRKAEAALAAAVFAIVLVATAVRSNSPLWRRSASAAGVTARDAVKQTASLIMLAYLWCGLAFYAVYVGMGLHWQHGWEYGSAMLLIGIGHAFYLWRLSDPRDAVSAPAAIERAVRLSSYQAVLIAIGLLWLIESGKLSTLRGDWAANQLFLAGGFAIMCLCVIMIKTNSALNERQAAQ
jgi:hypothetical protein